MARFIVETAKQKKVRLDKARRDAELIGKEDAAKRYMPAPQDNGRDYTPAYNHRSK